MHIWNMWLDSYNIWRDKRELTPSLLHTVSLACDPVRSCCWSGASPNICPKT